MHVEVRGIDIASERTGRGHPLGFLHGQGTGTQDSGTVRGIAQGIVDRYRMREKRHASLHEVSGPPGAATRRDVTDVRL
jgi:hypothetical protein